MAWSRAGSGGGATKLIQLTDVVTTDKAVDTTLKVNADGDHEYVPFPTGGSGAEKLSSLPTANSTNRGRIVQITGAAGVADVLYYCYKKADDTYDWKQIG